MLTKEITLNGHLLTAVDGVLYLDGSIIGFAPKDKTLLTKAQAKKLFHSKESVFLDESCCSDFAKSKDLDSLKKEVNSLVDKIPKKSKGKEIEELKESLGEINEKIEAIIEAFSGKPQKLNKLSNKR